MNFNLTRASIFVSAFMLSSACLYAEDTPSIQDRQSHEGYAIGVDLARNLKRQGISTNYDSLLEGFKDELKGKKLDMSEEQLAAALNTFQTELKRTRARTRLTVAEANAKTGAAFLEKNKAAEGIVSLPNGLQYKILKQGNGNKPQDTDSVEVQYRGTLINGAEFDSSYRYGKPAAFALNRVIPGWSAALKLMPVGSHWRIFIPPNLAYGENGSGNNIGPNETLIFDVELLAIKQAHQPKS